MAIITRDIEADTLAELSKTKTQLFHLVDLDFPGGTEYMSEAQQVTFLGNIYVESAVRVGSFTWGPDGDQRGSIEILNENNNASALALNQGIADVPIRIWLTYFDGSSYTSPYLLIRGALDAPRIREDVTVVSVLTNQSLTELVPRKTYTQSNGFNHLVRDGSTITWMDEKFLLEAEK